nr:MAG TPA: Repressor protein CI [Caudoviricetes sp.]
MTKEMFLSLTLNLKTKFRFILLMEKINVEFAERMAFVLDIFKGNVSELARNAGIAQPSATRWISGQSDPQMSNLVRLADAAKVSLEWLATGKGEPFPKQPQEMSLADNLARTDKLVQQLATQKRKNRQPESADVCDTQGNPVDIDDFVFIPYYDVRLSAGTGVWMDDEQPVNTLAFRAEWLQTFVTSQFDRLSVVKVSGDSMDDVLKNNDTILVDHTQNEVRDGLYALRIGNEVFVKRIQRLPNKLLVISANAAYPPFELSADDDYAIIGKVAWLGRLL